MTVTVHAPDDVMTDSDALIVSGCGFFEPDVDGLIFLSDVAHPLAPESNGNAPAPPAAEKPYPSVPAMARVFARVTIDDSQDEPPSPRVLDDDFGF